MTQMHRTIFFIILSFTLTNCYKVKEFTVDQLKWYKPFNKLDTVIFISDKNELDTLIFHKTISETRETRDRKMGAFHNTNFLSVPYEISQGSYHQPEYLSGMSYYYFLNMSKDSDGYEYLGIDFMGITYFDSIHKIEKIDSTIYFFDSKKADLPGLDLLNFTFDTEIGVINYTDKREVKWKRK